MSLIYSNEKPCIKEKVSYSIMEGKDDNLQELNDIEHECGVDGDFLAFQKNKVHSENCVLQVILEPLQSVLLTVNTIVVVRNLIHREMAQKRIS